MTTPVLHVDDDAYFDRLADVEARHWWSLGLWRLASHWLDAALKGRSGLLALDVGCGAGFTAGRLASRPEIAGVVGLEPAPEALGRARDRLPVVRAGALRLPFGSGTFDVVTCFDVLQHLGPGEDRKAAAEIRRVLAPGGVALLRTNGRGWTGSASTYEPDTLARVLRSGGLAVEAVTYANCLPAALQEVRGRLGTRGKAGHPEGGGLTIRVPHPWVNRGMGVVSNAEAFVAGRLGVRLPFGHSTLALGKAAV